MCSQDQISIVDMEGKDTSNQSSQSTSDECFCQKIAGAMLNKIKDSELDDLISLLSKLEVEFPPMNLQSLAISLIAGQLEQSMIEVPKFRLTSPFSEVSASDVSADSSSSLNASFHSDDSQTEKNKTLILIALKGKVPKVACFDLKPCEISEYFLRMGEKVETKSIQGGEVHYVIADSIEHIMKQMADDKAHKDYTLNEEDLKMVDEVLQGKL